MPAPADCTSKEEVRGEIDRIDTELVQKLAERFAYVRRMAELKRDPADAYDARRIDDVLSRIRAEATALNLDADLAAALWQTLIDWNVAYEARTIGTAPG